jgi:hypothetical protein
LENGEKIAFVLETTGKCIVSVKHTDGAGGCGGAEQIDVITDKVRIISQVANRMC